MKKFIAFLLTAILGIVALTGCGSSTADNSETSTEGAAGGSEIYRTLDEIKESGTIKIGVFSDKNPFGYVDENGEYQKALCEILSFDDSNIKVQYKFEYKNQEVKVTICLQKK